MLARKFRLRKDKEFEAVHRRGRFFKESFLAIRVLANGLAFSRCAFLIGTKASKRAVVRNRVRRQMSETVRLDWERISKGFDIVFMVRPEITEKSHAEIRAAVENVLRKANLISDGK